MKQLTIDEQICNLILAAWRWNETSPRRVAEDLRSWRCGSTACFGGHVSEWPEFQAQGVVFDQGKPTIRIDALEKISGYKAAKYLFGDSQLFFPRSVMDEAGTDHAVVARRLNDTFRYLTARTEYAL